MRARLIYWILTAQLFALYCHLAYLGMAHIVTEWYGLAVLPAIACGVFLCVIGMDIWDDA